LSLFVDASALVAMLLDEPEKMAITAAIDDDRDILWSPMSCWEAVSALRSSGRLSTAEARGRVEEAAGLLGFRLVPISDAELRIALDAYLTYGKGSGHRASLNMGDCFAYACAKANGARLLYKGNDFIHTDLA